MNSYPFSPEDCLVLKAVNEARSLREAARLLNCDPAGLQRKVQRISDDHGYVLKVNGRWTLTSQGQALVAWTDESILSQRQLLRSELRLRIASTSWFAEKVIIPALTDLSGQFASPPNFSISIPEQNYEHELLHGNADFIIVCHPPESPLIAHKQVCDEEWSVVVAAEWLSKSKRNTMQFSDLQALPFVQHSQLNPDHVFSNGVSSYSPLTIDNLVGVRAAVKSGLGWSFVPRLLVADDLKSGDLVEVQHTLRMNRKVCVWWLRSRNDSKKISSLLYAWLNRACSKR